MAQDCAGLDDLLQTRPFESTELASWARRWDRQFGETNVCRAMNNEEGLVFCLWEHPLGQETGRALFDRLDAELATCLGERAVVTKDAPVNHPDFFAGKNYQLDDLQIRVTLKHKGALGVSRVAYRIYDTAK